MSKDEDKRVKCGTCNQVFAGLRGLSAHRRGKPHKDREIDQAHALFSQNMQDAEVNKVVEQPTNGALIQAEESPLAAAERNLAKLYEQRRYHEEQLLKVAGQITDFIGSLGALIEKWRGIAQKEMEAGRTPQEAVRPFGAPGIQRQERQA